MTFCTHKVKLLIHSIVYTLLIRVSDFANREKMAQKEVKPSAAAPANGTNNEGVKVRSPKLNRRSASFFNTERNGR